MVNNSSLQTNSSSVEGDVSSGGGLRVVESPGGSGGGGSGNGGGTVVSLTPMQSVHMGPPPTVPHPNHTPTQPHTAASSQHSTSQRQLAQGSYILCTTVLLIYVGK